MALKRKRIFRRILAPVLIVAILISCMCVTAFADDGDYSHLVNLFDYGLVENYYRVSPSSPSFTVQTPEKTLIRYLEFVFYGDRDFGTITFSAGSYSKVLTVVPLGEGVYRVYGDVNVETESITITFGVSAQRRYTIYSFKYTPFSNVRYSTTASVLYNTNWYYMDSPSDTVNFTLLDDLVSEDIWRPDSFHVYLDNWKAYDYVTIDVYGDLDITSVTASCGKHDVPLEVSYYNPNFDTSEISGGSIGMSPFAYTVVTVDLTELKKSYPYELIITYTIMRPPSIGGSEVYVGDVSGHTFNDSITTDVFFFDGIIDFFTDLFGADDAQQEVIDQVQQNQADLNVSVNEQISSSVDSWNVNITTVKGSYDTAYQNTLPALLWLSSFANGIFNGMGWYANIFYMIGFVGIVALILSKSGLGSKLKKM